MANADTQLYASQGNGFKATVSIGEIQALAAPAATTTVAGVVKKSATQAVFAGADITALKVELNAFLVKLQNAGIVA